MSAVRILTTTEILAAATEQFTLGGYRRIETPDEIWDFPNSRLFEDRFGIVGLVVFETWSELVAEWTEAQGALVDLISRYFERADPKAWEGYLVLLTPGIRGQAGKDDWMAIRYNTKRIRKLVASGEDLRSISDVRGAVAPLLPLDLQEVSIDLDASVLSLVPELLAEEQGIDPAVSRRIIDAFTTQTNMIQAVHDSQDEQS